MRQDITDCLSLRKLINGSHGGTEKSHSSWGVEQGSSVMVALWRRQDFPHMLVCSCSPVSVHGRHQSHVGEGSVFHKRIRLQLHSTARAAGAAAPSESVQFPIRKWPTCCCKFLFRPWGQRPEQEWSYGRVCDDLGSVWFFFANLLVVGLSNVGMGRHLVAFEGRLSATRPRRES